MKKIKIKKIELNGKSSPQSISNVGGITRCWWIQTSPRGGNPNEGYYGCIEI